MIKLVYRFRKLLNYCRKKPKRVKHKTNTKMSNYISIRLIIEPILSYTDTAWGELSVGSSKSLQRLQNRAARIILKRDSSRDTFNVLGWTDLETNRKIHKCVLVFKSGLHNLVPQYLSNYFIRNYNVHGYNTRRKADLHLPKPKLSLGKRTFIFSGTALFNSLPCKIQEAVSLSSFKNLVKAHFIYST